MKRFLTLIFACMALTVQAQEEDSIPQQQAQPEVPVEILPAVQAQPAAQPEVQQLRFGYLSYDSALAAMPDYVIVQKQLADLREAYEAEMKRVEDEFNRKYEDFLEGQKDFPRTILLKRQTELQDMLQRNLEFKHQGLADLQQSERELLAPLRIQLNKTIATIAREEGLALVINTDANACPFIEPMMGVDLNDAIIKKLGK